MHPAKPLTTEVAILRRLYENDKKTLREIAALHNTTWKRVSKVLKADGIKMRNGHEARGHKRSRVYRTLAAQNIGRPLAKGEDVHHVNLDWKDNDPQNLVVVSRKKHSDLHKQLEAISATLFMAGLVTFDPATGYQMTDRLKRMLG
jgi:hypothetical protein